MTQTKSANRPETSHHRATIEPMNLNPFNRNKIQREYQAMKDRHIGNAIAAVYLADLPERTSSRNSPAAVYRGEVPERASSRNSYKVQQEIRDCRARGIIRRANDPGALPY